VLHYAFFRTGPSAVPDAQAAIVRKAFDAFGADRLIWGGLGMKMAEFEKVSALLEQMFDYASESDRAKIRGLNAIALFQFQSR